LHALIPDALTDGASPDTVPAIVSVCRATLIALTCIAILVAAPVAGVAFAGVAWGTIDCCCGEHEADLPCGCPDCPGADHDDDSGPARDGLPHIERCGANAQWVSPATVPPFVAPTVAALRAPPWRVHLLAEPLRAPPGRAIEIETPPS
jgi:hypothetical protein